MTLCDCQRLSVAERPQGLALYTASTHVRRSLQRHLILRGLRWHELPGGLRLPTESLPALGELLGSLSSTEALEVQAAAFCGDTGVQPWTLAPLERWVTQFESPWLDEALGALEMHAQPIAHAHSAEVYGHEALLRSRLKGELLGAYPLLRAAQAHGSGRALDARARVEAIRQLYPQLPDGAALFINFAPGVVYDPEVCLQTTFAACEEVGADFGRLVFEVTESEAFPDLDLLERILKRYRREGARVALDDLGAGHTSLSYLERLRPDIVKLDSGLIRGSTTDDPRCALVAALTRYAHQLGVQVVVEGVETAGEYAVALEAGADYVQGYFLARPAAHPPAVSEAARAFAVARAPGSGTPRPAPGGHAG